jgi:hypothetical protein
VSPIGRQAIDLQTEMLESEQSGRSEEIVSSQLQIGLFVVVIASTEKAGQHAHTLRGPEYINTSYNSNIVVTFFNTSERLAP